MATVEHPIMIYAYNPKWTFRTINANTGATESERTGEVFNKA